jgi:hypothetical protein
MRTIGAVYTSLWWKGPQSSDCVKRQQNKPRFQLFTISSPVFVSVALPSASGAASFVNHPCWPLVTSCFRPLVNTVNNVFSRTLILILLLVCGIHSNSGPSPLPIILQLNCNGLKNSIAELNSFLKAKQISVATIQETFLSDASTAPSFLGFSLVRKDRTRGRGGGLAFLIHHLVPYSLVDISTIQDSQTKCQGVKVTLNNSELVIRAQDRISGPLYRKSSRPVGMATSGLERILGPRNNSGYWAPPFS